MFETRIKKVQEMLGDFEIDALLITSSYNIAYLSGIQAFSIEEREARILVTKQNCYLFTDARYTEMVREKAPFVTLCEIVNSNPLSKQLKEIFKKEKIKQLGFEEENISYKEVSNLEEKLHGVELIPTQDIVEELREIKYDDEINSIRKACKLSDKAYSHVLKNIRMNMTEKEVMFELENFIRFHGGEISFPSIVAFGKNAAIPHHLSSDFRLQKSEIILLDFGAKVDGYCSDMTRTVFISEPNEEMKKMYNATKEAQEIAINYLKTHMKDDFETKKVSILANNHLKIKGFKSVPHGLGHGVGLQVHENPHVSPYSEEKLKPGMIVTVEPGVYVPKLGGVRIEDTVLITKDGIELLTKSSKELIVI